MQRCIQLAKLGAGMVAPNPMVGAVLVHGDTIIGEGYHMQYGQAHAEVNCINSVSQNLKSQISNATLYVSLEPCAHFGKTPPCTNFIIKHNIKKVIIGCADSYNEVNGKGVEQLLAAGVNVTVGVLQEECLQLNKRFFTFHQHHRPYIVLKFAKTADGFIGKTTPNPSKGEEQDRLLISNDFTNKLVHQWRSTEASILIGINTALQDNPSLNNRLWKGKNPVRLVIDKHLKLPSNLQLFNRQQQTIVFNFLKNEVQENIKFVQINREVSVIEQLLQYCYDQEIQSILVEGGSILLQSFIDANLWDEARVVTNQLMHIKNGYKAPVINASIQSTEFILNDRIDYYFNSINE